MNLNLISLVCFLLFFIYANATVDNKYFEKSIFRALKKKNGQFKSEIDFSLEYYGRKNAIAILKEKYSFKLDIGEVATKYNESYRSRHRIVYLNGEEAHSYHLDEIWNECYSFAFDNKYSFHYLGSKINDIVGKNYSILGKSNLLFSS